MKIDLSADCPIDLEKLVDSRLLVQANSGGGKSWCIRRILEQSHGHVQQLVIDPEGEFSTLREKFDYVLAARNNGDTIAEPRSAKLLAERLLELGVSAILDIYELKAHDRIRFVRGFLEALVDAPKALWHPALVVVDEAHVFCPQQGEAESAGAVIDLATRGRKRGFCAVLATQRLSKLHKDAAAECNNKLIGRTGLDVDRKRAADELGLVGRDEMLKLRELAPGSFYAFGPAISVAVRQVKVGSVTTQHPKAGSRLTAPPPQPTAKIRALLPKLADLPAEAEKRQTSIDDLQRENAKLRRELTQRPTVAVAETKVERIEVPVLSADHLHRVEAVAGEAMNMIRQLREIETSLFTNTKELLERAQRATRAPIVPPRTVHQPLPRREIPARTQTRAAVQRREAVSGGGLPKGERAILIVVAQYPDGATREQLTVMTGYKRSSRDAYLQRLREKGYIDATGELITPTDEGMDTLGSDYEPLPVGDELRTYWFGRLPEGERRILEVLCDAYPEPVERPTLDEETGYKRSSRDAYLQRLGARKLVVATRDGVRASEQLFQA